MLEVLLIRPGCTTFDEEGRIKGALDIPLSELGNKQALQLADSLKETKLDCLYVAPAESAQASGKLICDYNFCRSKTLDCLRNLDHGLWQGKLVSEVKRLQPKVYRQFQENPEGMCPPEGETIEQAIERIQASMQKLVRKHDGGSIGLVVPQPMASIVRYVLLGGSLGDLWKCELDFGTFETLRLETVPATQALFART
ncbi:MAG: histidine phosphatase family protein [Planctomycetota bacterium]